MLEYLKEIIRFTGKTSLQRSRPLLASPCISFTQSLKIAKLEANVGHVCCFVCLFLTWFGFFKENSLEAVKKQTSLLKNKRDY